MSKRGYCPHFREVMDLNDCYFCYFKKVVGSGSCRDCVEKYGKDKRILWYCPEGKTPETCVKAKGSGSDLK